MWGDEASFLCRVHTNCCSHFKKDVKKIFLSSESIISKVAKGNNSCFQHVLITLLTKQLQIPTTSHCFHSYLSTSVSCWSLNSSIVKASWEVSRIPHLLHFHLYSVSTQQRDSSLQVQITSYQPWSSSPNLLPITNFKFLVMVWKSSLWLCLIS
jgi:hypothetical protein